MTSGNEVKGKGKKVGFGDEVKKTLNLCESDDEQEEVVKNKRYIIVRVSPRLLLWTCRCSLVTVWLSFLAFSLSGLRHCFWLIDLG